MRALPGLRRLPLPGSGLRRSGRGEGRLRFETRCGGSAASRSRPSIRSSPPSRRSSIATRSSTPSPRRPWGPALGFHKAGRWDEVLEIEKCWLTTDLGNSIRNAVRDWAREENLVAYDQSEHTGYLRHLVIREGRNTGQALVVLVTGTGGEVRARLLRRGADTLSRGAFDPLGRERLARRGDEPSLDAALGRGRDRGAAARAPLPRPPERLPADEHGDGREALRARDRVRRR